MEVSKYRGQLYKREEIYYNIDEILSTIKVAKKARDKKIMIGGKEVKTAGQRYSVYQQSKQCYCCGLQGEFLAMEKHAGTDEQDNDTYHFNLYGIRDGKEVLMTQDHIVPKSSGGANNLGNLKTMCADCNTKKGAMAPDKFFKSNKISVKTPLIKKIISDKAA